VAHGGGAGSARGEKRGEHRVVHGGEDGAEAVRSGPTVDGRRVSFVAHACNVGPLARRRRPSYSARDSST
jgi:hypothetical protein